MSTLAEFVECSDCEFVLLAENMQEPEPQRVDECPNCGGIDFTNPDT